jgi:hypothetical protein
VIKQERTLAACPHIDKKLVARHGGSIEPQVNLESIQEKKLRELQDRIRKIGLASRAEQLGGRMSGENLVVRCLGREFAVGPGGAVTSDCHTHAWFSIPLLDYILSCTGSGIGGTWVPLRELPSGGTWSRLFEQRCEKPLKELADRHGELFQDLISLFSAQSSYNRFNSDLSVVLYPLPAVPVLVCYWHAEDDMDSRIHIFFDASAESHLHIDSIFTLATGIVMMLQKITGRHGEGKSGS